MPNDLTRYVRFYQSVAIDADDDDNRRQQIIDSMCDGGSLWYEQPTPIEWLFNWTDCLYAGELPEGN